MGADHYDRRLSDAITDTYSNGYSDGYRYTDADSHSYSDRYRDTYGDSYGYSYSDANARANHWLHHNKGWRGAQHDVGQHCYQGNIMAQRGWSAANSCQPIRGLRDLRSRRSFSDDDRALDLQFRPTSCSLGC